MPIDTVQDLKDHLRLAARVELSLVPVYLYAMYSIEDQSSDAAKLIKSVVVEEMLHATLDTNMLLALGGEPDFESAAELPSYPMAMWHHVPELILNLEPCSVDLMRNVFLPIERPEERGAPIEADYYETQGQFYYAIEEGFERLAETHDLFAEPQLERQVSRPDYYGTVEFDAEDSGGLVLIQDLDSAVEAIEIVVHQGEGLSDERWADPDHQELTHYYKFLSIEDGTSPIGAVYPVISNPKTSDLPDALRPVSNLFNAAYREIYYTMSDMFAGPEGQEEQVSRLYLMMSRVLSPLATFLMQQPVGDGMNAGPTFEIVELAPDRAAHLAELAHAAADAHPALEAVATYLDRD